MTDELPLVSIVTPSLDQAAYIGETIASVQAQDYPRIEHVVVDGGSTDGTVELLRGLDSVRWVSEADRGQADAINKGFAMAQGEIFAWLNADDVYLPGAVARGVEALIGSGAGLAYGGHRELDAAGNTVREYPPRPFDFRVLLEVKNFIPQPSTFFTADAFRAVGGVDLRFHYAMDYDLWLRIARRYPVVRVDAILAGFRLYADSKTGRSPELFFPEVHRSSRRNGGRYFSPLYVDALPARHPILFRALAVWRRVVQR